ncbi:MAG: hypothetical protein ACYCQJ_14685 [Nitrososphaerales archaeon]
MAHNFGVVDRKVYRILTNGNIENSNTIYVNSGIAHRHQIEEILSDALQQAKSLLGPQFESDFIINHILNMTKQYVGYSYIDVSNPAFYHLLIGNKPDGSENIEFIEDPVNEGVKVKVRLPPLITLKSYLYDEHQRRHIHGQATRGVISISPAYITPGVVAGLNGKQLFVSNVPSNDPGFLHLLFDRYARTQHKEKVYPIINIRKSVAGKYYATVTYFSHYDTAFALLMNKKIRAMYNDSHVEMNVRYAEKRQ